MKVAGEIFLYINPAFMLENDKKIIQNQRETLAV
ncbi:hypothetical protein EZS27_002800 [termite gut metagenome]|uniref:Uncharacterized protein n=1 Tax=termite gut metagenome TaxID=433724 RepID=A0A5J4SVI3_9ZZZZ